MPRMDGYEFVYRLRAEPAIAMLPVIFHTATYEEAEARPLYERILGRMREKVRTLQYVVTVHAEEEMSDDDLTILDLEHGISSGKILERQRDAETRGWKYVVGGPTLVDDPMELVARLSVSGKLVIVTVYRA